MLRSWQIHLGVLGTLLWLVAFPLLDYSNKHDYYILSKTVVGFTLGCVTAFAGYLFWEIIHGRWERILGAERGAMRILSSIPLLLIALFSSLTFLNGIFNSMPWYYKLSYAFASIFVLQGAIPIINVIESDAS